MCWSKATGEPLCNAIVWDDTRTAALVDKYEAKLDEEGFEVEEGKVVRGKKALVGV